MHFSRKFISVTFSTSKWLLTLENFKQIVTVVVYVIRYWTSMTIHRVSRSLNRHHRRPTCRHLNNLHQLSPSRRRRRRRPSYRSSNRLQSAPRSSFRQRLIRTVRRSASGTTTSHRRPINSGSASPRNSMASSTYVCCCASVWTARPPTNII
jgi:hypothetical protein